MCIIRMTWALATHSNTEIVLKWYIEIYLKPLAFHIFLCFVVVIHWLIFPYPSGLFHWHCGNLTIAPVPAKQPWWIWIKTSCEFITNDCITTTKQSTAKPCAYSLGYTVPRGPYTDMCWRHFSVDCWAWNNYMYTLTLATWDFHRRALPYWRYFCCGLNPLNAVAVWELLLVQMKDTRIYQDLLWLV